MEAPVSSAKLRPFSKMVEEEGDKFRKFIEKVPTFYEKVPTFNEKVPTLYDTVQTYREAQENRHEFRAKVMPPCKRDDYILVDMAVAARYERLPPEYLKQKYYALDHSPDRFLPVLHKEACMPDSFALRPGRAMEGEECTVKTNHFFVKLSTKQPPSIMASTSSSSVGYYYAVDVFRYDVSMEKVIPPLGDGLTHLALDAGQDHYKSFLEKRTNSVDGHAYCQRCCDNHPDVMPSTLVTSSVNRDVMAELVRLYKESHLGNKLPAYDGKKSLYTAGRLPFWKQEFKITLRSKDSLGCLREMYCKVTIKFASPVNTSRVDPRCGERYLPWSPKDSPPEALKALNTVLWQFPSNQYTRVGQYRCLGPILGNEICAWSGFCQRLRPTQMGLSLNIDISSTVFTEPLPVAKFITQFLQKKDVLARPLSDADHVKLEKVLKGLKVEFRGQKYCISGLASQPTSKLNFPADDSGTMLSMFRYFQVIYGIRIRHVNWPCLKVGNTQKPSYLPIEACVIVKGQRCSKRLNKSQTAAFLKVARQSPQERAQNILKTVRLNYDNNEDYGKEFGITMDTNLTSVEARILPSPRLKYHDYGVEGDCVPQVGVWDMKNKKLFNGGSVERWTCINFAESVSVGLAHDFCHALAIKCRDMGMVFNLVPWIPVRKCHRDQQLKRVLEDYREKIELLLVILPDDNGSLYGDLKRICETDIGIVSQCCLRKHVVRRKDPYLTNVALKINVKVGGRNTVLADALSERIPIVSDVPSIIFGADVSHPQPGGSSNTSIAAVVASQDWPEITKYAALVCSQAPRQELIKDLYKKWLDPIRGEVRGGMIRELLLSFYITTGCKPHRIIFYRDGVSEGQFCQVLSYELDAIRQACASLDDYYQPPVTFVMVQKRHHTRLFRDLQSMDGIGNVLPGTVVDSKICHPTQFDFYLCSHAGIQGTSRPVRYHVLWDENNFSADNLQSLTNNLCYTYARCTRSVSIVPPAYYAHLAAVRARFYMEPDDSESNISAAAAGHSDMVTELTGGKSTPVPGANAAAVRPLPPLQVNVMRVLLRKSTPVPGANAAAVRPLPPLHANVKRVMFYC